ncbi:MAG: GH3 auxin-responsive promoter family protein [Bacteroidales bacterium]|jgi:hypothetical protein|nr:GH3 auxin-responsive promoter family protein [Bacteroidales bacterium]
MINTLIQKIVSKRLPQIENFMKNPIEVQEQVFINLIKDSQDTVWGKYYDYASIQNWQTFNQRIPVNDYESLTPFFNRIRSGENNVLWNSQIKWFSKSSGTTGSKSKFIPVSEEALNDCHYKGGKDMLTLYCHNYPENKLFDGRSLALGGSRQENPFNDEIFCGDVSAIIIDNLPLWAELYRVPNKDIALMPDWEEKLKLMVQSVTTANVASLSGVPSWMMVLLKAVLEHSGKQKIMEVWQNLEVYFHGGVSFAPYRTQFEHIIGKHINYMETYNASEGFFGLQDRKDDNSLLLLLDYGIYYEFIATDDPQQKVINLSEVETGKNYAMLISTNAGLWRYKIGDTISFTHTTPYRFKITGRTKHFINACGEEVIVDNATKALDAACRATNAIISEYTAAPMFGDTYCHQWLIEFEKEPDDLHQFADVLDRTLQSINSDYEAKRYKDMVLKFPVVQQVPPQTFYNWLKRKNKLGGQHKIPRLFNTREYIDEILAKENKNIIKGFNSFFCTFPL